MNVKFVDYKIEHKGYWDYGYQYWLSENFSDKKGKPQAKILITTNDIDEVFKKIKELTAQSIQIVFEDNESYQKHIRHHLNSSTL